MLQLYKDPALLQDLSELKKLHSVYNWLVNITIDSNSLSYVSVQHSMFQRSILYYIEIMFFFKAAAEGDNGKAESEDSGKIVITYHPMM